MESMVTKQGVRDLNSLGPQRQRPPRDDKPRKQRDAETQASAPTAAPTSEPTTPSVETTATPVPAADKT